MLKKALLLSALVPFLAQAVEIINDSSKTITFFHISDLNHKLFLHEPFEVKAKESLSKNDISCFDAKYEHNDQEEIHFRLGSLSDDSKVTFIESENGKVLASVETKSEIREGHGYIVEKGQILK